MRFAYKPPSSASEALSEARSLLAFRCQTKNEVIDSFINGERILNDERLCYVILSSEEGHEASEGDEPRKYDWLMGVVHFLGDGYSQHRFANDFFVLLGADKSPEEPRALTVLELEGMVHEEWEKRWGSGREVFVKSVRSLSLSQKFTFLIRINVVIRRTYFLQD